MSDEAAASFATELARMAERALWPELDKKVDEALSTAKDKMREAAHSGRRSRAWAFDLAHSDILNSGSNVPRPIRRLRDELASLGLGVDFERDPVCDTRILVWARW